MAASYRSFGTYPNVRNEIVGTWADILASGANDGDFAMPADAWGCSAEWKTGAGWTGFIGDFTSEVALAAVGVAKFATGAFARVSGNSWNYGISGGAWGPASGTPTFGSFAELVAGLRTPGARARLANPLSPTGDTEMYYDGTTWRPVPKQELVRYRNADGITPVLELTAVALPLGAWTEVWQSAVLPNWMFQGGQVLSLGCDSLATDSSSTATLKARVRVHDSAFTIGDTNDGIIGQSVPGSIFGTGLTAGAPRFSVGSNNSLYGTAGAQPFVPGTQARRILGRFGTDATRIRFDFWPGAATNVIRLYSVSLYSE